jgi:hypothetical protein
MMAQFGRPGSIAVANYHSYIAENKTLHNIGLASYTRNSLDKFGLERKNSKETVSKDILEYFDGAIPKSQLLGDGRILSIMRFDKINKRYALSTESSSGEDNLWWTPSGSYTGGLIEFQKGFINDDISKYKIGYVWSKIQNSMSGCITFKADYTVLGCSQSSLIKLYFQSAGKSSTERSIAQKGSPIVAGVPTRATGAGYANVPTQQTQPGQYTPPLEGGVNNPENTVAGKLRMSYDPATGQWESGTQQAMFRLLTDIDGVPQIDLPSDIDNADISSFYSGALSSKFNVGSGMIVSTENGNPHLFGPNTNGCGSSAKEKVLMINRTPRNYKAGEYVIGSLINGEWIPIGLGVPSTVGRRISIEWSQIQKYIVDAKSFFRNSDDSDFITPEDYTNIIRFKFYSSIEKLPNAAMLTASGNDLRKIAILNLEPNDPKSYSIDANGYIKLSRTAIGGINGWDKYTKMKPALDGYFQFFDADVLPVTWGGNNNYSRFKRGNIKWTPQDMPDMGEVYAQNVTSSWGMYFRDGYTSASVSRLKNNDNGLPVSTASSIENSEDIFTIYRGGALNFTGPLDANDTNLYHLPAQIGLNSSGNPSLYMKLADGMFSKPNIFAGEMLRFFANPQKGDYLFNSENKNVYGLTPNNSSSVQFTPLSIELALCGTKIPANHNVTAVNGGYANLRNNLAYQNWTSSAFGEAWKRIGLDKDIILDTINGDVITGKIGFGKRLFNIPLGIVQPPTRRDTKPDGGPDILPYIDWFGSEASNVNGIIGARATVTMSAGGQLELRTNNHYGLNAGGIVGGNGGFFSFIPTMFGIIPGADGTSQTRKYDFVQWGTSSQYGDLRAFGTTALFCQAYDHCPNTIFDARFMTPIQIHGTSKDLAGKDIDISMPAFMARPDNSVRPHPVGTIIKQGVSVVTMKNPIRRNMLLTGGGFYYIKRVIGANNDYVIENEDNSIPMTGYEVGDIVTFPGSMPPTFRVSLVDGGRITAIELDIENLGIDAYGEIEGNIFKDGPVSGSIKTAKGKGARIWLKSGKVIEKVMHDELNSYNLQTLTPPDNNGGGDDYGYVRSSKSTTYNLDSSPNGKYDLFFFFVNDIANYLENSAGANAQLELNPFAQYVNLDISVN